MSPSMRPDSKHYYQQQQHQQQGKKRQGKPIGESGDAFAYSANPAGTPSLNVSMGLCQLLCGNSLRTVVNTKGRHSQLAQRSPTSHRIQLNAKWEMGK